MGGFGVQPDLERAEALVPQLLPGRQSRAAAELANTELANASELPSPGQGRGRGGTAGRTGPRSPRILSCQGWKEPQGLQVWGSACLLTRTRPLHGRPNGLWWEAGQLVPLQRPGPRAPWLGGVGTSCRTQEVSVGRGWHSPQTVSLCIQEEKPSWAWAPIC